MAKEVVLTNGMIAIVDDVDFEKVNDYKWRFDGRYASTVVKGETKDYKLYLHRLVADAKDGEIIDHINRNKLDNRRDNLRLANYQQNSANSKLHGHNTTGFRGVYRFSRGTKRWRSAITVNGKQISLGYYTNPIDAAKAYNNKAYELFGDFAVLNEIKEENN